MDVVANGFNRKKIFALENKMRFTVIINSLGIGGAEKLVADSFPLFMEKFPRAKLVVLKKTDSFLFKKFNAHQSPLKFLTTGSVYNPFLIFKLILILKKSEVVHLHLFPTLYWVVLASFFVKKKPVLIYTEHNTHNKRRASKFFQKVDRWIYKRLDYIVSIAEEVDVNIKNHLQNKYNDKILLIHNGVDLDAIYKAEPLPKQNLGVQEDDIILLQVSSFRWQKDHATLIKAMSLLPQKYKLLLAGEGPLKEEMRLLSEKLGVAKKVSFLGNRADVPALLKTTDIVVLSSKHEGLSLSSVEAMASGKPFVASDVPGLREIVKDYGVLFEQGNAEQLAKIILKLTNDSMYRQSITEKCLSRAQEFGIEKMTQLYMELYKRALQK